MNSGAAPLWPPRAAGDGPDVMGIGQISLDRVCIVEELAPPGAKSRLLETHERPGGQVATAMLACAKLGLRAAYVGVVGDDAAAEAALEPLRLAGVDLSGVQRVSGARTRQAVVLVEQGSGERVVFGQPDPPLRPGAEGLEPERIARCGALHVDASDPDTAGWAVNLARAAEVPVVLDADAPGPGVSELVAKVDFPIISGTFDESLKSDLVSGRALQTIHAPTARLLVATLGARGAIARAGDRLIESPGFRVEVRDTTGAGDVFHAGFVWALLEGRDAEEVLRAANAAAALSCRGLGAQGGLPSRDEVEALLAGREPGAGDGHGGE